MIAGGLAFSLASWWGVGVAAALWVGSIGVLQRMGKADPLLRRVYLRHIRYVGVLSAKSGLYARSYRNADRVGDKREHANHRTSNHARAGLADLLLPFAMIEDGILLQQDGSLLAGWSFRGPDMHSATHAEMDALTQRFNSVLRLGQRLDAACGPDPLPCARLSRNTALSPIQ